MIDELATPSHYTTAGSDSESVPSGTQATVLTTCGFASGTPWEVTSASLGGQAFQLLAEIVGGGGSGTTTQVWVLIGPPTGSQTFARSFSASASEGPHLFLTHLAGSLDTLEVIDSAAEDDSSVTIDSETDAYVLAMIQAFTSDIDSTVLTEALREEANAGERAVVGRMTAGASTTTVTMSGGDPFPTVCAVSLREVAGAPTVESLTPADNATDVSVSTDLTIVFDDDEAVEAGTGNVEIWSDVPPSTPTVAARTTDTTGTADSTSFQIDWTIPGGSYSVPTIVFIAISKDDDDAFTSFPPSDWDVAFNTNNSTICRAAGIWRRFTSGSTSSVTVTGDSESYAARVWLITGVDVDTNPFCPTPATGSSAAADPPNAEFPWGTDPTLVLAVVGGDGNGSASGFPTDFDNTGTHHSGHSTAGSRSWLAYAERANVTSGSSDPSAFTNTNEQWIAATVAFRGAWTRTLEETIAITDTGQVSFSGDTVTIEPTPGTLEASTQYHVEIDSGAIEATVSGLAWPGFQDATSWNFTTGAGASTEDGDGSATLAVSGSGVGASTAAAGGTSSTAVTAQATGASAAAGAGEASTPITAAGVGEAIHPAAGTASLECTGGASGASAAASAGTADCAVAAAGIGGSDAASIGASSVAVTSSGVGQSAAGVAGTASLAVTASAAGAALAGAAGSASLVCTAVATGESFVPGIGAASCVVTGQAVGTSTVEAQGTASVAVSGAAAGLSVAAAAGSASLAITAEGDASSEQTASGAGASAVTVSSAAAGASTAASAGSSGIECTASGTGSSRAECVGTGSVAVTSSAVGASTGSGVGAAEIAVTAAAAGIGLADGQGTGEADVAVTAAGVGGATAASSGLSAIAVAGSASGSSTATAAGSASVACSTAADGEALVSAVGTASIDVSAEGSSVTASAGVGASGVACTAAGAGASIAEADGSAELAVTALSVSEGVAAGAGAASVSIAGSAAGVEFHDADGAASLTISAEATGLTLAIGAGSASVTVTGEAVGAADSAAAGEAALEIVATSAGSTVLPPVPPTVTRWGGDPDRPNVEAWAGDGDVPTVASWGVDANPPTNPDWTGNADSGLPMAA